MSTPPPRLNLGLIGCGFFGRALASALTALPGVRLAAVADVSAGNAEGLAAEIGADVVPPDRLATLPDLHGVVVATPNDQHAEPVVAACEAGRHVFVEKPMALTAADCDRMAGAARAGGVRLVVGHIMRTLPAVARVKAMLDSGALGTVRAAHAARSRRIDAGGAAPNWWKTDVSRTGGELRHENHELDLLCWLLGEPTSVTGYSDDQVTSLVLRHGDAIATYQLSTIHRLPSWRLSVEGTLGAVEVDFRKATLTTVSDEGAEVRGVFDDDEADGSLRASATEAQRYNGAGSTTSRWMRRALDLEMAETVRVFRGARDSPLLEAPDRSIRLAERFLAGIRP
ncbi:oxidoreductase [Streptosporangium violaceochromogenes]|nr:oxidoreductase [Streptosporangium violaceochromogenes]